MFLYTYMGKYTFVLEKEVESFNATNLHHKANILVNIKVCPHGGCLPQTQGYMCV